MKFTYNVGDKLVAKEIKTIANIFNHYVPAGSVVTLLENVSNKNGYELIKIKASDGIHFATSAAYFDPYIEKENHSSEKDKVIDNLVEFMVNNLDEEDLDDFIATAATVIEKAYPGFLEKYNKNKEKCCEGEDCNCSEDCNCLCENCDCGKDKKIEETASEVEAYSGKIYCVKSGYGYITEGKIYEVKKGMIEADDGWKLKFSSAAGVLATFEDFSKALRGTWVEVKKEIPFNLKKVNPYNGKVICIFDTEIERFTEGNIYEVKGGILCDDSDGVYSYWNAPFESVEQINEYCNSEFAEIKE
jgi:hypothetical protein